MQFFKILLVIFSLILPTIFEANAFESKWKNNQNSSAKTKFIGSYFVKNGEEKLIGAVHFKIKDGWKIYGNDFSGFGLPPNFDLSENKNYVNHEVFWPEAKISKEQIGDETLSYLVYENEIIIPFLIEKKDDLESLKLKLSYGICKNICIPVDNEFDVKIEKKIDEKNLQIIVNNLDEKLLIPDFQKVKNSKNNSKDKQKNSILYIVIVAIIGGAILNIMPCVLPVLSIKIISLLKNSRSKISTIRRSFIATIIGILFCFASLALIAALIKASGNHFGWGLQFQNPYFLVFLIIILIFFIANLLGIFEINFNQTLTNILDKKITQNQKKHNFFLSNFLSGILAVLLATPCSAPFLGSAISFALAQDFAIILLVFLAIGVGFALPYFILLINPKLVYLLPKPGKWMNKIKKILAILLASTVIWLFYILSHNIGMIEALLVVVLSAVIFICFKISSKPKRYFAILLVIALAFTIPMLVGKNQKTEKSQNWIKFNEENISKYVNDGKIVIVDITADWCITCKFNKYRVFKNKNIEEILSNKNIVKMRGDITKHDAKIMKYLEKNSRFAIPFNAVYGPNLKEGKVTKELLKKTELIKLIEEAK